MNVKENLTLMIWMTVSVYPSFVFIRVTFPSFLRPYIFLTTFFVNKEQYAMELKGCVSHYEGLRTYVEWLFGDIVNNLKFSDFKKNLKICTRPEMIPDPK